MNIHYPVPERASRSMLWLLVVALILASLLLAYQATSQLMMVNVVHQVIVSGRQANPQPLPVPEPPHSQPTLQPRVSSILIPQGVQLHPAPQPIPTPPYGQ